MKIGIITLTGTSNYGAALQIHALQKVIEANGVECETINYYNPYIVNEHDPKGMFRRKGIKRKIKALIVYGDYKRRMKKFKDFEKKYCKISEKTYDITTIHEANNAYDCFVTGSDQVWNYDITHKNTHYFLDFAESGKKLCSYAASSGMEYIENGSNDSNLRQLEKFSVISVRESSLCEFLKLNLNDSVSERISTNIDPTLLLDKEYWKRFIESKPCKRDYIFLYLFKKSEYSLEFIKNLRSKYNCDVIWLKKTDFPQYGFKCVSDLSPDEFLNYIYHAKFVITGSFHAACFSIQFGKELYMTVSPIVNRTARLQSLAHQFGLDDRVFSKELGEKTSIDYDFVYDKLSKLRDQSMKTINIICNENIDMT